MADKNLPSIDKEKTGENIRRLMRLNRMSTWDVQKALDFQSGRNVYSWTQGKVIPSAENLMRLAYLFNCKVDDILIKEEP